MAPRLTELQRRWAEAYVGDARFNAAEAARIAGMRPVSKGRQMRAKPHVMAYVEQLQRDTTHSFVITRERVLQELAAVAFSDATQVTGAASLRELPPHVRAAVQSVKVRRRVVSQAVDYLPVEGDASVQDVTIEEIEYRMHPKIPALELLAKHTGLLEPDADAGGDDRPALVGVTLIVGPA